MSKNELGTIKELAHRWIGSTQPESDQRKLAVRLYGLLERFEEHTARKLAVHDQLAGALDASREALRTLHLVVDPKHTKPQSRCSYCATLVLADAALAAARKQKGE